MVVVLTSASKFDIDGTDETFDVSPENHCASQKVKTAVLRGMGYCGEYRSVKISHCAGGVLEFPRIGSITLDPPPEEWREFFFRKMRHCFRWVSLPVTWCLSL